MRNKFIKIGIIFFVGFFLYLPSLFFDFTYFDDQVLILENLNFLKNLKNFLKTFETEVFHTPGFSASYYRPILTLSFMFDAQFSQASPFFYHFSNIVYHLISTALLFLFFKKIKMEEKISFYFALIFLVHPVLTQAVSWIPGRNDSLLTIFTLSCFIFLIDYLETRKIIFLIGYFLFFTLALLTKETAILIPFFTLLFLIFFYRKKKFYLLELFFGWWFIIFFWIILRQKALNNVLYLSAKEIMQALIFNSPALIQYFGKIFYPFNLSVLPTIKDTTFFWGILAIITFLFLVFIGKKIIFKPFFFGVFWFVLFLLPNFIRPNPLITADFLEHRVYLPLVGFLVSFASIQKVSDFFYSDKNKFFVYFLILFFSMMTFFHQFKFKNRLVFWKNAVDSSPHSPLAHKNYGVMLYFEGKLTAAEKEYKKSLEINPNEPMVHNNLGVIYFDQKNWQKAKEEFEKELKINPSYDKALFNLGRLYYQLDKRDQAKKYLKQSLKINPRYYDACQLLIKIYQEEDNEEKLNHYLNICQQYLNN